MFLCYFLSVTVHYCIFLSSKSEENTGSDPDLKLCKSESLFGGRIRTHNSVNQKLWGSDPDPQLCKSEINFKLWGSDPDPQLCKSEIMGVRWILIHNAVNQKLWGSDPDPQHYTILNQNTQHVNSMRKKKKKSRICYLTQFFTFLAVLPPRNTVRLFYSTSGKELNQGWALRSFPFRTFRSFPF